MSSHVLKKYEEPLEAPLFETIDVLGTPIAAVDYGQAIHLLNLYSQKKNSPYLVGAANVHVVTLRATDYSFESALDKFSLIVADGKPIHWSAQLSATKDMRVSQIRGPELMRRALADLPGKRHFLFGGTPEGLQKLVQQIRFKYPQAVICGTYSPPFGSWSQEELEKIFQKFKESQPDFVWTGLGCPKQETWLGENKHRLPPAVYLAVGAAFDFIAGTKRMAPLWMQKSGLEWLFRFASEPRRLWKRYLKFNSLFIALTILSRLGLNRRGKI